MAGSFRAFLIVGAAARLSLLLEMHTRTVPNAPKLIADLRNKVANVSGLNSTGVSVEILPDNFFFPCPEILPSYEPEFGTVTEARQLHPGHGPHEPHGPHGPHGMHFNGAHEWHDHIMKIKELNTNIDREKEQISEHGKALGNSIGAEIAAAFNAPREETCPMCLAAGKDYCIAENRCTARATRTCEGPEDHVTGSPEFARLSPGHSMKCPRSDPDRERGFLEHHGRKGFPVLLEVHGAESDKLIHDLRAHAADLSATGCETAGQPCKVSFELYECPVRARRVPHYHHHHHRIPPFCGVLWAVSNVCCCLGILRLIRLCLCGGRRDRTWRGNPSAMSSGNATAPFLQSTTASPPVQGRIVNGVILPYSAPSAGPAPTAAPQPLPAQALQPAVVFPAANPAPGGQFAHGISAPAAPAAIGYCPSCGVAHPINHRFCGACGNPLPSGVSSGPASSGPAYPQLQAPMQAEA